jgi:folate-binding protein YgfZ
MPALQSLSGLPSHYAIRLSNQMLISLEGEQADSYLHGQVTVNVNELDNNKVRFCAHCDNKGKTWSVSMITRMNNEIVLLSNKDAGAHSLAQLNKYGVFSKVDIVDKSDEYNQYFISQALAESVLTPYFDSLPQEPMSSAQASVGKVFKAPLSQAGYYLIIATNESQAFEESLTEKTDGAIYSQDVYNALLISNVIPSLSESGVNEYIPQMLNVQAINGIDFDKGCYMGQEVVARTRFLGKNKRAAYSFTIPEAIDVEIGSNLEKQLGDNWRRAGMIIASATLAEETWIMAVLANDTQQGDAHRLAQQPDIVCYPNPLPYNIEQAASKIVKKRK